MTEKKPFNHPDYRIPGTNAFSLSKWSRENDPKPPARYKVGDPVVLVISGEVTRVYEDCDGTPLYEINGKYIGHSDTRILPGVPGDWEHDAATLAIMAATREIKREDQE